MHVKNVKWRVKPNTRYFANYNLQSGEYCVLLATLPSNKIKSIFQQ